MRCRVERSKRDRSNSAGVGPVAGSPLWETLALSHKDTRCPRWVRWPDVLSNAVREQGWTGFLTYLIVDELRASHTSIASDDERDYDSQRGDEAHLEQGVSGHPCFCSHLLAPDDVQLGEEGPVKPTK